MSRLCAAVVKFLLCTVAALVFPSALIAQAPTGDVVISANTTWPTATYSLTSLTVQSGATLTVGGGSTVTTTSGVKVTGQSNIVLQAANNTAKVNGTWQGAGVSITAASVQVDAGSSINADAQGYISPQGPGTNSGGVGGSYGGLGGQVTDTSLIYGSATTPTDLGSGGGGAQYAGSNGGGAIRLVVSGTLTNNGVISANGEDVQPSRGGAGSGGSVYVTTGTLAGSGKFAANGGVNPNTALSGSPAGGGGRVAVYYASASGFTGFAGSTASGGTYASTQSGYIGSNGTSVFFKTSGINPGLSVYQAFTIPANTVINYDSISIQNGATLTIGGGSTVTVANGVTVTGSSSIVMQGANTTGKVNGVYSGVGVTLQAGSVQVDAGSSITANAQGYLSSAKRAEDGGASGGSGGSYGGVGGYQPGPIYGSASAPVDLGSGGAGAQYAGSNGGGAIHLIVSGTLTNNGIISANGQAVLPSQGGAGAGGSVYVTAGTLVGSGSFTANGGSNTTPTLSGAAAAGGGRVAVYYAGPTSFTGFASSTASGGQFTGTTPGYAGTNGTAAFFDTSVPNGSVSVYQSGFQIPANTVAQYNSIAVANGAAVTIGSGSAVTVASTLSVGGGSTLTIGGGSTVTVANGVTVTGNSSIVMQGADTTGKVNGVYAGVGVTLKAGSVQVDAGSSISADAQGYLSSARRAEDGGASGGSGGSYGGLGGYSPGPVYGSSLAPLDLGSGGAGAQYAGSNGGGAIRVIVSGTLTNNGIISANGQAVLPAQGGAGSGGSVYVTTAGLTGSGIFTANGGSNTTPNQSGAAAGGGGRVAIHYTSASNFTGFTTSTAAGGVYTGAQTGYAGFDGTVAFFDDSVANSNVNIYHGYTIPANSNVTYNNFTLGSGGSLVVGGNSQIAVTQTLRIGGAVTTFSTNTTAAVGTTWQGKGVVIAAGSLQVDPTGSINADGQGYVTGAGPGFGSYTTGGSYGGAGGGQIASSIYGSATAPLDLGSGGGGGQNTGGGAGGGALQLLVSGAFTNNGIVSAKGGSISASGYGGGGSGGSIFVQANTVLGSGTITANGGSNTSPNNAGSGGGGGRISINYGTGSPFSSSALTVSGGTGANPGAIGSINSAQLSALRFLQPTKSVAHGAVAVQSFSGISGSATITVAGLQSSTLAVSGTGLTSVTWDTTVIPDGVYELRIKATDATGTVYQNSKSVIVNNSVKWFSGTLTANTHWTANNVYAIDGDLVIPSGITLTVDPGTVVKVLNGYQILVQSGGTLVATGTNGNPVTFTTFNDSSVGGNSAFNQGISTPVAGAWGGISVASGATFTANALTIVHYAFSGLSANVTGDTTLNSTQVYEITGTLNVGSGATLTIQPGAIIKFDPGAGINLQPGSALVANGTLAQPIYFTAINDNSVGGNTNNNDGSKPPQAGDWNSISVNGANASFNHVQMQYGGGPANAAAQTGMLETSGLSNVTLANSILANSYFVAIQTGLTSGGDVTTITNSVFYGNQDRVVNSFGGSTVHIINSTFDGNASGVLGHGGSIDIANSVFSNSNGTRFATVQAVTSIVNSDVYTTAPGVSNYGGVDPTGTLGNISAKPVYMNAALHDYHPTYGSPLIDAANGTVVNYPLTDAFGNQRNNFVQVLTKTGTPDTNGKYPDIGAYEFVQAAPSNLDLTVSAIQGPASAAVGAQVPLMWTVTNVGSGTVYGPWHDAVFVASAPNTNLVEALAGEVLVGNGIVLGPGASYQASGTVTVPGSTSGVHQWEVKTNVRGEVFEGANTANNRGFSLASVNVTLPQLVSGAGPINGSFAATSTSAYYEVSPLASQGTLVQLALTGVGGSVQLFVGSGYVPSPQHYDYQSTEFNSSIASVTIPAGATQAYYIAAYPQTLQVQPSPFSIRASAVQFSLTNVTPNRIVADGDATLTFIGGGFTSSTTFKLVSSTGAAYSASSVFLSDSSHAQVTFHVSQFPIDQYTAQAIDGPTVTLVNAVYILQNVKTSNLASNGSLQTFLEIPQAFRYGFPSLVTLHYTNVSGSDLAAPMISLSSLAQVAEISPECDGCSTNLPAQYANAYTGGLVLGINSTGPAGILPSGASGSIPFLVTATIRTGADFVVSTQTLPPIESGYVPNCDLQPVGTVPFVCPQFLKKTGAYATAADFCGSLTPSGVNPAGSTRACMLFFNKAGFSYIARPAASFPDVFGNRHPAVNAGDLQFEGFNKVLADDATALSTSGSREYDVQRLLAYEFQKDGSQDFAARYHQGAYGYGPSHPFDITLSTASNTPVVTYPDGSTRAFSTPSPTQQNVFLGPVGDYGTIAMQTDTSWLLTEPSGTIYRFTPNGSGNLLDYIQDRAGNHVQLTYTGKLVTKVVDVFGNTATFQYDANGHITSLTDPSGRVTSYTYTTLTDTQKSTFLKSVTDSSGTTTITWNQGGPHGVGYIDDTCVTTFCEPAIGITSVAYPDGTHTYFTYDAAGRETGTSKDGGAQAVTYTYNKDGSVSFTDALGKSTLVATGQNGLPIAINDPLGNIVRYGYNAENRLVTSLGPLGDSASREYDTNGNVLSNTSPMGYTTSLSYGTKQNLLSITGADGNTMGFNYDGSTNITTQTYSNGTQIAYTYDAQGRVLTRTNRRGKMTTFTYNPNGLVASKTFANGSQVLFAFDGHRNLQSVSTAAGSTRYTYDASDRMTGIANPDGTSLQYTYNAGGQRTRMTDSTGFATNYTYDAVGRLSSLSNSSGALIVSYTYDASGHLSTKTLANGTSASYAYDAAGSLLSITNKTATNAILSEYDYTYDAEGNPVTQSTPGGTSNYTYDLDGQLISASAPSSTIQYTYDAAGNRTQVTTNGVVRTFQSNNLNQYTSAGASAYQYDVDGNLISGDGWIYGYDDENHLVSMTNSTDAWTFQYDGLGQRVGSVHNGIATRYLIDSVGSSNVTAEFNGSGKATAHYTYGIDLTSSVQASGTTSFYHFDGTGNTTQMTNTSGSVVNSYAYKPFGEATVLSATVANPFTYSGRLGVRDEGAGLYFMRNRWYNPALGHFQQIDPAGLLDGTNPYKYADNSPVKKVDPTGLIPGPVDYYTGGVSFGFSLSVSVNAHTGECFIGFGFTGGAGANVSAGAIVSSHPPANQGEATSDFLGGESSNISAYAGGGGGVTTSLNSGVTAVEGGYGGGGKGGGISHSVSTNSTFVQHVWDDANNFTGGRLFGTDPESPFGPRVPKPPLPGVQPIIPCRGCLFKPGPTIPGKLQGSQDPNAKMTTGFGDHGYIPAGESVTYTIFFENQPTATLPAQRVIVTDQLSSNLDWSTVELNQIGFNNVVLNIPDGTQTYTGKATVTTDPNPVSVKASLNPATGLLTWTLQSVDSVTGGSPANPLSGFLPPDNANLVGTGFLVFTVEPKANLANSTAITNQATIIFDANAAILTNTVTNTLDLSTPTSAISPLPASTTSVYFPVSWSGTDPAGSGIANYSIYVSTDAGPYTLWLSETTLTTANYLALPGHSYSFVSFATDNVGTSQITPAASQTIAVMLIAPTVAVTTSATTIAAAQSLTVSVAVTGTGGGTSGPTGTVALTSGAYISSPVALVSGVATFTLPAGALAPGSNIIGATYTPDALGTLFFSTSTGSATVIVGPGNVQVTVGASGAGFSVDGTSYSTTQTLSWIPGSSHTLATVSPQTNLGIQQTFTSWSDGGALSHTVTASSATTTYNANFSTAYLLTTSGTPTIGGTVSPITGTYYPAGTVVNLTATPSAGYSFASWTGAVASTTTAATTITMSAPRTVTAAFTLIPVPVVTFAPSALTFTSITGITTATQTVQINNTGTGLLNISSIAIGGASPQLFAQTNTCGTSLAAGASCTLSVTFTPSAAGTFAATLTATDNATGSPHTVTLSGIATLPPTFLLAATPSTQIVAYSGTTTYTINATSQGGTFGSAIDLTASGLPVGAVATFLPASITPGAAGASSVLTIKVPATIAALTPKPGTRGGTPWPATPALALLSLLFVSKREHRKRLFGSLLAIAMLAVLASVTGCGSSAGTSTTTPAKTFTIIVTGTSGSTSQTTTMTLTVK